MASDDIYPQTEDILGQLPLLKAYTHLTLLFALPSTPHKDLLISSLTDALHKVTTTFPFLAGKVINQGRSSTSSGRFVVASHPPFSTPGALLHTRDLTITLPSMTTILAAKGPSTLLPGTLLSAKPAFPESYHDSASNPAAVLDFQLSYVEGGVFLNCAAQHNMLDMGGIGQVLRLLAKAIRREEFSVDDVKWGSMDRRGVVRVLREGEAIEEHRRMRCPSKLNPRMAPLSPATTAAAAAAVPPSKSDNAAPPAAEPVSWHYFRISATKLAELKTLATPPPPPTQAPSPESLQRRQRQQHSTPFNLPAPPNFISSDDALCALLWQRLTYARQSTSPQLQNDASTPITTTITSTLCRAIDARPTLSISPSYMGDTVCNAHTSLPLPVGGHRSTPNHANLLMLPLHTIASALRASINRENTPGYIRSFATLIASTADKSTISYAGGGFNPDVDIAVSSWVKVDVEGGKGKGEGWGDILGKPKLVRRPAFGAVRGLVYFMPRVKRGEGEGEGDTDVLLCERQGVVEALRRDGGEGGWAAWVDYIG